MLKSPYMPRFHICLEPADAEMRKDSCGHVTTNCCFCLLTLRKSCGNECLPRCVCVCVLSMRVDVMVTGSRLPVCGLFPFLHCYCQSTEACCPLITHFSHIINKGSTAG